MTRRPTRAVALAFVWPVAAWSACEVPAAFPAGNRVDSPDYVLGYRTVPPKIEIGKHFSVEAVVCPKAAAPPPKTVAVDAHMPEHRHGMNYRATVSSQGEGRYRADGLMFHMPGRWQFVFEVEGASKRERLTKDVVVE
jgi:hypothetical protein